jgi:hypothetical protein
VKLHGALRREGASPGVSSSAFDIDNQSTQFLLAEYELIRNARESTLSLVENRIKFVLTLQSAQVAFIGALLALAIDLQKIVVVALALGAPTLLLSHIVFLRALDFQIQGRRYLRAINAIRQHFVMRDVTIKPAIHLPYDVKTPRMSSVGEGSSLLLSFAVTMLILTSFLLALLAFGATWLLFSLASIPTYGSTWLAVIGSALVDGCYVLKQLHSMRHRLKRAEASYG